MLWSDLGRLLGKFGFIIPEYFQFLIFELILMPILAYGTLLLFVKRFCVGWLGPILCTSAYALSGTGLWNNAWMFYQEWANIFFLLFALDFFFSGVTIATIAILGLAVINSISSANYWSLFSFWFVSTFVAAYCLCRWDLVSAVLNRQTLRQNFSTWRARLLVAVVGMCILGWIVFLASIYRNQAAAFIRYDNKPAGYTMEQVYGRSQTGGIGRFTSQLFQPVPAPPPTGYLAGNWMHTANYIGIGLFPLLVAFFVMAWLEIEVVLFTTLVITSAIASGSGVFITLWRGTPGMYAILHAFYFYSYFVQLVLLFIAARSFDRLLTKSPPRPVVWGITACGTLGVASLIYLFTSANYDWVDSPAFNSFAYAGLFLVLGSAAIAKAAFSRAPSSNLIAIAFLVMIIGDLGRYYYIVSDKDRYFTLSFRKVDLVAGRLPGQMSEPMRKRWLPPVLEQGFNANLLPNLPVVTSLWPDNDFNPPQAIRNYRALDPARKADITPEGSMAVASVQPDAQGNTNISRPDAGLRYQFKTSDYNSYSFDTDLTAASTVVLKLTYDPSWIISVNGSKTTHRRINGWMTAIDLPTGPSQVEMSFWPTARYLYLPLRWLTYLACFSLVLVIMAEHRDRRVGYPQSENLLLAAKRRWKRLWSRASISQLLSRR